MGERPAHDCYNARLSFILDEYMLEPIISPRIQNRSEFEYKMYDTHTHTHTHQINTCFS